jgi:hypothetical protein
MALLYYWVRKNYTRDFPALQPGADRSLEQNSESFARAQPGTTLWAFTRRSDDRYVLAAHLVVRRVVDQAGRTYRYGRYSVDPLPGSTVMYDVSAGDDVEPLIRTLVRAEAATLGNSFVGNAAVREIDTVADGALAAFAQRQAVLAPWRRRQEGSRSSDVLGSAEKSDCPVIRASTRRA